MISTYDNLYDVKAYSHIKVRVNNLDLNSKPIWGELSVAQMMAHVTEVMKNGLNETKLPRKLLGYLIAPFWRHKYYNNQPYKIKNLPTAKQFKIVDQKDFEKEKEQFLYWLKVFHEEGRELTKNACHPLLGRFTPEQWAIGQYKHMDYHLRQFGV